MERKIGEIFDFLGKKLKCVESKNRHCSNCWFLDFPYCYMYTSLIGEYRKKNSILIRCNHSIGFL